MKTYYIHRNVGKSKFVVSYCNGLKKHPDDSDFFDIAICKSQKVLNEFVKTLEIEGYKHN